MFTAVSKKENHEAIDLLRSIAIGHSLRWRVAVTFQVDSHVCILRYNPNEEHVQPFSVLGRGVAALLNLSISNATMGVSSLIK